MKGNIHSTESFGTVDGPSIRFVVFTMGCPLRCQYCHNPDTWKGEGMQIEAKALMEEILKYRSYIQGVTVSGGEPLLQPKFCEELFALCKQNGLDTALDTSGYPFDGTDKFDALIALTDYFLLDIKHIDEEKCRSITGKGAKNTLAFAKYLSDKGKTIWIRHVLFSGTDDDEALKRTRAFIDTLKTVEKVQVLPYHTLGKNKYEKLGIPYPLTEDPPSKERIAHAKELLGAN